MKVDFSRRFHNEWGNEVLAEDVKDDVIDVLNMIVQKLHDKHLISDHEVEELTQNYE